MEQLGPKREAGLPEERKNRPLVEFLASTAEIAADVAMDGDLFASIPIVGTAIQAVKAMDSIRDKMFAAKIIRFVTPLQELTTHERDAMVNQLKTAEDVTRVGEVLLLSLDRVTELDKARLLGELFVFYARGAVDSVTLRRITRAFDAAFYDDLEAFIVAHPLELQGTKSEALRHLAQAGTGLVESEPGETWGNQSLQYRPSKLGEKLRDVFKSHQRPVPENFHEIEI